MTGIPVGGLPKIKDDKVVFQASHPSLWNGMVIEQMRESIDAGKFKVLDRPAGRIVLFEVEDGNRNYDTTLGYSHDWVVLNIPDPSLAEERRAALVRVEQKKARAAAAIAHSLAKEKEERKKADKAFFAQGASAAATTSRMKRIEENAKKKEEQERAKANATAFAKHRLSEVAAAQGHQTPYSFEAGRKHSTHSEASTPHSEPSAPSSHRPPIAPIASQMEPSAPAVHPRQAFKGKQRLSSANSSGNYQNFSQARSMDDPHRTQEWSVSTPSMATGSHAPWSPTASSPDPIRTPIITAAMPKPGQWPPPGYPRPQWSESKLDEFHSALTRFFGEPCQIICWK